MNPAKRFIARSLVENIKTARPSCAKHQASEQDSFHEIRVNRLLNLIDLNIL
jgi:hypothetical protein